MPKPDKPRPKTAPSRPTEPTPKLPPPTAPRPKIDTVPRFEVKHDPESIAPAGQHDAQAAADHAEAAD